MNEDKLGRVLGTARGESNKMVQWRLKDNGNVLPHYSLKQLRVEEIHSETEKRKSKRFDILIKEIWVT